MEAVNDIQKFRRERKESEMIEVIKPVLDSVNTAIQQQNLSLFKSSYILLTNTCNNCHRAANFEFIVVKIPETQTVSNQDFEPQKN